MSKFFKIFLISCLILLAIFIIATLFVNITINNKITTFLETRLPSNITQTHTDLNVDTFDGTVTLNNVIVNLKNKSDTLTHTIVKLDQLIVEDVSYWDYLFNDEIHIEDIKLKKPEITYYKDKLVLNKDTVREAPIKLYKPILIDELSIDNTNFTIIEKGKDSILLYTKNTTIEIDDLLISKETLLNKIPVTYSEYEAQSDSIFVKISPYENVTFGDLNIKDHQVSLNNIQLKTKYSRKTLSKIIKIERDHFDVTFNAINIKDVDFGFNNNNNKLFVKSPHVSLENPNAIIYRDKLVADDPTIKSLYSKMLRDMNIDLTIDEVAIKNANLTYTERVKEDNSGGTINFSKLYTTISNASNTYPASQKTRLDIQAVFMKDTPFTANWEFDTTNTNDQFSFKAEIGKMTASDLNTFMQPNLNVKLEGTTNKTYFTINGNNTSSNIDMRMSYDDFKVNILQKEGKKKNKLFSAIANIFIKKDSDKTEDGFREGSGTATRDKTKSFFNYLWLNIRNALKNTLMG